jgi:hypothetical protein
MRQIWDKAQFACKQVINHGAAVTNIHMLFHNSGWSNAVGTKRVKPEAGLEKQWRYHSGPVAAVPLSTSVKRQCALCASTPSQMLQVTCTLLPLMHLVWVLHFTYYFLTMHQMVPYSCPCFPPAPQREKATALCMGSLSGNDGCQRTKGSQAEGDTGSACPTITASKAGGGPATAPRREEEKQVRRRHCRA